MNFGSRVSIILELNAYHAEIMKVRKSAEDGGERSDFEPTTRFIKKYIYVHGNGRGKFDSAVFTLATKKDLSQSSEKLFS